jgi:hypothetical protein
MSGARNNMNMAGNKSSMAAGSTHKGNI